MPAAGSNRVYYRIAADDGSTVIGAIGTSRDENHAFIYLSRHFAQRQLPVPAILAVDDDELRYIVADLGSETLFHALSGGREAGGRYNQYEKQLLVKTIRALPNIQMRGARGLEWEQCYPQPEFDENSVLFDLNYFKYCFLKATGLEFNEVRLQDDFDRMKDDIMENMGETFMYRDFQARNIMVKDGEPYFIDFQGGRKGPIYYDVASFVWQARSRYPESLRKELVRTYLQSLKSYMDISEEDFNSRLRLFVLFRTLQVLGAYGFRGYFEKKPHFLGSVPYAMSNLRKLLREPFTEYPYLNEVLDKLTRLPQLNEMPQDKRLEVKVFSFAYKKGIPADNSGNGGGYVFDCRAVNNPGKYEHYRQFTGLDPEVIKFLEDDGEITDFLAHVYSLVDFHVKTFIERKFTHLQVSFGCTGGQHRSVYCAEHLAKHLSDKFDIKVTLCHRELGIERIL